VHDEIIFEAKTKDADYFRIKMEDCLSQAFKEITPEMPFAIEARIANSWGRLALDI